MAAFATAFNALPDEVSLWSPANIYDFAIRRGDKVLRGSFRLDAANRDRRTVTFILHGEAGPDGKNRWEFGRGQGVKVTPATPGLFVVYFEAKAVIFRLDDHGGKPPGEARIRGGETYLGAVEDETGLGFFLLRQEASGLYFYTLDEDRLNEDLLPVPVSDQIRVGARSGFVYYRDRYLSRWILIGVGKQDAARDKLYGGPFDQTPDFAPAGSALNPFPGSMRPNSASRPGRSENTASIVAGVLVPPYIMYTSLDELGVFDQCAARAVDSETYYRCFAPARTP